MQRTAAQSKGFDAKKRALGRGEAVGMAEQLTLRDGLAVDLRLSGRGRPIVFVHGWAMNGRLFDSVRRALDPNAAVLSYDLRAHGDLRDCPAPTIEKLGKDLAEIVDAMQLDGAVLVGWSMGAMIVWDAMSEPKIADRVAGVVSIDMSPRITNDRDWTLGLADGRRPESTLKALDDMRNDWSGVTERFVPRIFAPENVERLRPLIASITAEAGALNGAAMADLWESMAVQDFRRTLRQIETPMLAMHGADSPLYPVATGRFIARTAPNAELSVFQKSGHAPHLEEPERFAATLIGFIHRLERPLEATKSIARSVH